MKARAQIGVQIRDGLVATMTRLPDELHKSLVVEAEAHCRSMNAEIIKRLQESFIGKPRVRIKMARVEVGK